MITARSSTASKIAPFILLASGCRQSTSTNPSVDAAGAASSASSAPLDAASANGRCSIEPRGGVPIPSSSRATDVRLAASSGKALVTWYETTKTEGPDLLASYGHAYDGSALSPRITFDKSDVGDEFHSGAFPIAVGNELAGVSCYYAAPSGGYRCARRPASGATSTLFDFRGIAVGGPSRTGIAIVTKGDDILLAVPGSGSDALLFSSRVSGKKTSYPFPDPSSADGGSVDGLVASLIDDEAVVVYRTKGNVVARRAGFDQTWHGKPITLSTKGALVGAPVVASDEGRIVVLFSQRMKATDPWRIVRTELVGHESLSAELATGNAQAQGPAIVKTSEHGCFLVAWVEGTGKATRSVLARTCNGTIAKDDLVPISQEGVESGRAILAVDSTNPTAGFVVWQELPPGSPVELRIAKLSCR